MPAEPSRDDLLDLWTVEIETRNGPRRALVGAPRQRVHIDAQRLNALRSDDFISPINERLLAAVDRAEDPVHLIIFKAGGTDGGGWGYGHDLDETSCAELGYQLVRSQLRLYRHAAARGVLNVVGVEFGARELDSYGRGTDRLASELEHEIAEADESAIARLDLWLIDHIGLWSGASLEDFLLHSAAEATAIAERHQRRIRRLIDDIDAAE